MKRKTAMCFNASTNVVGGAVQNSANFMRYSAEDPEIDWYYVVSPQVLAEARKIGFDDDVLCLQESPAQSASSRRQLYRYVAEKQPEVVYTMAGPAYVSFPCTHVMGCSNPYLTNLSWQSLSYNRSFGQILITLARSVYQAFYARKADAWIFQTEASRKGFMERLFVPETATDVVPNAVGKAFDLERFAASTPEMNGGVIKGLYPAAYYPHKAHMMIPDVLAELKQQYPKADIKLSVTLKKHSPEEGKLFDLAARKGVVDSVVNIGPYSYSDAPDILAAHDFVFFPSILEVFSTSYLEAMASARPLVVADKDFAREVCGRFATYFKPLSSKDAARKIMEVLDRIQAGEGASRPAEEGISSPLIAYDERYSRIRSILLSKCG
ncbi:glycosyltransferase [Marinobacter mangrovi]|uniref:glycosyltransferase n=1 Tax=Marinobacter mangrovi TaxID=2803918 RepID=UPI0019339C2D|nr:glycosyltransferase [Marinobacter mangrovi]